MPTTWEPITIVRVYGKQYGRRELTAAFNFYLFFSTNKVLTCLIIYKESFHTQSKCMESDNFCTRTVTLIGLVQYIRKFDYRA